MAAMDFSENSAVSSAFRNWPDRAGQGIGRNRHWNRMLMKCRSWCIRSGETSLLSQEESALGCLRNATYRWAPATSGGPTSRSFESIARTRCITGQTFLRPRQTTTLEAEMLRIRSKYRSAQKSAAVLTPVPPRDLQCTISVSAQSLPRTSGRPRMSRAFPAIWLQNGPSFEENEPSIWRARRPSQVHASTPPTNRWMKEIHHAILRPSRLVAGRTLLVVT